MGSNDQSVNDLHPLADQLAHAEEEVVVEEEDDDEEDNEDEDVEEEEDYDDACLWHDPFLERHNLEMEIVDEYGLEMVEVPEGGFGVADEGSILDVPLLEGARSTPYIAVSGQNIECFLS